MRSPQNPDPLYTQQQRGRLGKQPSPLGANTQPRQGFIGCHTVMKALRVVYKPCDHTEHAGQSHAQPGGQR